MVVLPVVYTAYTKLLETVQCKISFRPFTKLTNDRLHVFVCGFGLALHLRIEHLLFIGVFLF